MAEGTYESARMYSRSLIPGNPWLKDIHIQERDSREKRGFYIPWVPEKVELTGGGAVVASYDVMNRGQVDVPTGTNLREVAWSGTFPGWKRGNRELLRDSVYDPKTPDHYHNILTDWLEKGAVLTLIMHGYPFLNLDVVLVEYTGYASGAFGDWEYTVKFREKRDLTVWLIKPAEAQAGASGQNSDATGMAYTVTAKVGLRVRSGPGTNYPKLGLLPYGTTIQVLSISGNWANITYEGKSAYVSILYLEKVPSASADTPAGNQRAAVSDNTYTIKRGDSLWKIAAQQLGNGARWQEIFTANQEVLETTAQKYGSHCTLNSPVIYAGTVISIPSK